MLPLVSYSFLLRRIVGPLPEQDLVRAHSAAPDVLMGLRSVDQRFWLSQGLQSLSASVIALAGHLLLGWSVLWILAALTIDLLATVLGDWLKLRLAPGAVVAEMSRALEADFVLDTASALNKVARWNGPPGPLGLEPHRARWRQVNADDAMLCLPGRRRDALRSSE